MKEVQLFQSISKLKTKQSKTKNLSAVQYIKKYK